nr:sterol desaturase family protein [Chthonobacter albigriseus]
MIVVGTVVVMEGVAYASHRWIMHGWGWGWHQSHHEEHDGIFEQNDLYAVVFAGVAILLFAVGAAHSPSLFYVAVGVTIYGALYFVVHDGLVHQRWPFRRVPKSGYLKRLVQAHRLHHAIEGKDGAVSFGFLYAPPVDELRAALKRRHGRRLGRDSGSGSVRPDGSRASDPGEPIHGDG